MEKSHFTAEVLDTTFHLEYLNSCCVMNCALLPLAVSRTTFFE